MMQIVCNKHGRLWDDFDTATCQNLDIACHTCNFWSCFGCTTLHNSVATAITNILQNNGISVGRNLAKILTIFEKIDVAKIRGVI